MAYFKCSNLFVFILFFVYFQDARSVKIQPGKFEIDMVEGSEGLSDTDILPIHWAVQKSLFNQTEVKVSVNQIDNNKDDIDVVLTWELRSTPCQYLYNYYLGNVTGHITLPELMDNHDAMFGVEHIIRVASAETKMHIKGDSIQEQPLNKSMDWTCYMLNSKFCEKGTLFPPAPEPKAEAPETKAEDDAEKLNTAPETKAEAPETKAERKRAVQRSKRQEVNQPVTPTKPPPTNVVTKSNTDGSHLLVLKLEITTGKLTSFPVTIDMKGPRGYLSSFQYPLLQFYGIMCGLYIVLAFTWLLLLCYQYKDLLGIQIWIGVVILLGLIEKAVFFAEFEHMNNQGEESATGILFPELVSCMKRTLARLLVVIVSIGYGITRPRLGNDLNYVMAAGLLYMLLSSAEAIMRNSENYDNSLVAVLPLSILDAILVWWIFRNLVDTTRTLRLRQNESKLWLYRHFTNTLLLCIVLSIIYFVWSFKTHKMSECVVKWHELWLDDAFWHILFCVILVAVMILFRPSINNQRYAYSPLADEDKEDEESKQPMLSEAYDGMKMRTLNKENPQNAVDNIADDLKWVEDNIPAAIADTALAMMDDSEEEVVTNLERSKMD